MYEDIAQAIEDQLAEEERLKGQLVEKNWITDWWGIDDESVDSLISRGKAGKLDAAWFAAKKLVYDGVNLITFDAAKDHGQLTEDWLAGKISNEEYDIGSKIIFAKGLTGVVASTTGAGFIIKKVGTSTVAYALEGAAIGAAYDVAFQLSDIGTDRAIYELTDGRTGVYKTLEDFSVISLGINTVSGAGIGAGLGVSQTLCNCL